jgi:hypothetical protein
MLKTFMMATAALTLVSGVGMSGVSFAQSSTSSSTTVTTPGVAPTDNVDETTTTRRIHSRNGVLIEKDTDGTEITSPGVPATTHTTTQTTTVR